ncbi:hypothetical protein COCVIDRAFT_87424, partial [Bipolaris victoriae FI3]
PTACQSLLFSSIAVDNPWRPAKKASDTWAAAAGTRSETSKPKDRHTCAGRQPRACASRLAGIIQTRDGHGLHEVAAIPWILNIGSPAHLLKWIPNLLVLPNH